MEQPPNNIETSTENENRKLIKEQIRRVSVFGPTKIFDTSDDNSSEKWFEDLGKNISDMGLTTIVGASGGSLGLVSEGAVKNEGGKVISVGTTKGREAGYEVENVPGHKRGVYYEGGHGAKQEGLFDRSGAFIALPGASFGTFAEVISALDSVNNFDNFVGDISRPIILVGDYWRELFKLSEPVIKFTLNNDEKKFQSVIENTYFVDDISQIEDILIKYAKIKQKYETEK